MERKANGGLIVGLILVIVGLMTLVGQLMPATLGVIAGPVLLLGLGVVFLVVGVFTREAGWFIPGGILSGLGAGVALMASPWAARLPGDEGGWFLLTFAAGWLLIPLLTAVFAEETHWWALIPAGIIGLVGLTVVYGGVFMVTLEWIGRLWPLALIAAGVLVLWKARRPRSEPVDKPIEKVV
jgi:hypothetical protein